MSPLSAHLWSAQWWARVAFSPRGLFWLLWFWVLYYVSRAVWGEEAFAAFVAAQGRNPLVLFISLFTLVSLAVNFVRFARRGLLRHGPVFAAWLILPLGALVFLAGFLASSAFDSGRLMVVQQAQEFAVPWDRGNPYRIERIDVDVNGTYLEAGTGGVVLHSEPQVYLSSAGQQRAIGAFPPTFFRGAWWHILDFGLAPGLVLMERGEPVLKANVSLRVLPPGLEDFTEIEGLPYRIYIRLAPSRILKEMGENLKLYDLDSPRYFIRVERAGRTLFDGDSKGEILFDEFSLKVSPPAHWVWLKARQGVGVPLVWAGAALMAAGLPLVLLMFLVRLFRSATLRMVD